MKEGKMIVPSDFQLKARKDYATGKLVGVRRIKRLTGKTLTAHKVKALKAQANHIDPENDSFVIVKG